MGEKENRNSIELNVVERLESFCDDVLSRVLYHDADGYTPKIIFDRGFDNRNLSLEFFDFIKVREPRDNENERFILATCAIGNIHMPRCPTSQYNASLDDIIKRRDDIIMGFRKYLEEGKVPEMAYCPQLTDIIEHKVLFVEYMPVFFEIKNPDDIAEIEDLVQQVVKGGLREDIIIGTPESMKDILARIENQIPALDFDYNNMEGEEECC